MYQKVIKKQVKKVKQIMARPSKYHSTVQPKLDLVKGWAADGLSDEQIAHNLGIATSTLYEYKKQFPEFVEAIKKGKDISDYEVQNALFNTAKGFSYYEETTNAIGEVVRIEKYAKPNTTAQIFWLKNRCPDKWRDKTEVKQDVTQTVTFSGEDDIKN